MWLKLTAILFLTILALDVPWVLLNTRYGIYKGFVNGPVTHPAAVMTLWVMMSAFLAILLTAILRYVPRCQAPYWALFMGFSVYFTINATALCMFSWSFKSGIADTIWGTVLYGIVGLIGLHLIRKWECRAPAVFHPAAM